MARETHPLVKEIYGYLWEMQNKRPVDPAKIKACFETACDTLPKDVLRNQFMCVMNEVWRIA